MYSKVNEKPRVPSQTGVNVPVEFDRVIARALARDPEQRYPSAGDLGRAAKAAARGERGQTAERSVATGLAAEGEPTKVLVASQRASDTSIGKTTVLKSGRPRRNLRWAALALVGLLAVGSGAFIAFSAGGKRKHGHPPDRHHIPHANRRARSGGDQTPRSFVSYRGALFAARIPTGWNQETTEEQASNNITRNQWGSNTDPNTSILIDAQQPSSTGSLIAGAESVRAQTAKTAGYHEVSFGSMVLAGTNAVQWIFQVSGDQRIDYFFRQCGISFGVLGSTSPASFPALSGTFRRTAGSVQAYCGGGGASGKSGVAGSQLEVWPAHRSAYTVIVRSATTRSEAVATAKTATSELGLTGGVLYSSDYPNLQPGYWVAFLGRDATAVEAKQSAARIRQAGYADAYARFIQAP